MNNRTENSTHIGESDFKLLYSGVNTNIDTKIETQ